jgi:RNA polymerase sigma factor (sigma-70 family)
MTTDQSTRLQGLLDRARQGDDAARQDLLAAAYDRLLRLARQIFRQDFARLKNRHHTESVLHEALLRMLRAPADRAAFPTPLDFFRYSAVVIRHTLLDMIRHHARRGREAPQPAGEDTPAAEPGDRSDDPAVAAMWSEFHRKVEELPEEERAVVDLHWYHDLSQAETARLLGLHEKAVSRRWLSARLKIADWVPGWEQLVRERG